MPGDRLQRSQALVRATVVERLLKCEGRKEMQGIPKGRRGNPAKTLQEYKHENKRAGMEVEWLRGSLPTTRRE